ncbi:conserved hypothetical protein [Anaeromyxobacter dehalogenans 2CP-1]|uniref:Glycosyltransferase RgtA/B/C/D-like domain-containing protein n=1 Tax=Anaeromyxobacter dehalogenans (strain ATCC BAA-258 / DSM 21875 / 2CP-1) TaxID=455488 RepID=B8J4Y7_ANAD2|nr:hypothetical protein [Anaeromyxobacter dehalogenans]ACL64842.1 conserved hypothetical protein [Anaeromyxobacter dehalogenans 2CP-1]
MDAAGTEAGGAAGTRAGVADRAAAVAAVGLLVAGALEAWAMLGGLEPARFWDTPSYLHDAVHLARGEVPPLGLRMPGYPAFVALVGGRALDLAQVAGAQAALWIASVVLAYALVRRLTGGLAAALAAGLAALSFVDLLFMAVTIYSETLCLALVCAAALATAAAFTGRTRGAVAGAGLLWAAAALVRPIFLASAGVYLLAALVLALRRALSRRDVALAWAGVAGVVLAMASLNLARAGRLEFSPGAGLSLLNHVGHPAVYRHLPPDQARIREVYERLAAEQGREWIGWWRAVGPLAQVVAPGEAEAAGRLEVTAAEPVAERVALRAIAAVPGGYLRVWAGAAEQLLGRFALQLGWSARPDGPPQWPPGTWQHRAARAAEAAWQVGMPWLSAGALLLPPLALWLRARRRRRHRREDAAGPAGAGAALATLWAIALVNAILSPALEPWAGQMRYRFPIQHLLLGLVVSAAVLSARALRPALGLAGAGEGATGAGVP